MEYRDLANAGRRPLSPEAVQLVEQLLADGLSDRVVAKTATAAGQAVSRTSVIRIRRGKYRQKGESTGRLDPGEFEHSPTRCPVCGATNIISPCRTCRLDAYLAGLRKLIAKGQAQPPQPTRRPRGRSQRPATLDLAIRGDDLARLEDVRRRPA